MFILDCIEVATWGFDMGHGLEQVSRDPSIAIIIALLLHIEVIDSTESLQLVIMEWLSETYCTLNQLPFDQLHSVVPTIQLAGNLQMAFSCTANALRVELPNVCKSQEGQQWRVKFLTDTKAHCYPPFMNSNIRGQQELLLWALYSSSMMSTCLRPRCNSSYKAAFCPCHVGCEDLDLYVVCAGAYQTLVMQANMLAASNNGSMFNTFK